MSKWGYLLGAAVIAAIAYIVLKFTNTAEVVKAAATASGIPDTTAAPVVIEPDAVYTIAPVIERAPAAPVVTAPEYIGEQVAPIQDNATIPYMRTEADIIAEAEIAYAETALYNKTIVDIIAKQRAAADAAAATKAADELKTAMASPSGLYGFGYKYLLSNPSQRIDFENQRAWNAWTDVRNYPYYAERWGSSW